jgi:hypothetical protein
MPQDWNEPPFRIREPPASPGWNQPPTASRNQPSPQGWDEPPPSRNQPSPQGWDEPPPTRNQPAAFPGWDQPRPTRNQPSPQGWDERMPPGSNPPMPGSTNQSMPPSRNHATPSSWDEPASADWNQPSYPGQDEPAPRSWQEPASSSWDEPTANWNQPSPSDWFQPRDWSQPQSPGWNQPNSPGGNQPAYPGSPGSQHHNDPRLHSGPPGYPPQPDWNQPAYPSQRPGPYGNDPRWPPRPSGPPPSPPGRKRRPVLTAIGVFLAVVVAGGGLLAYFVLGLGSSSSKHPATGGPAVASPLTHHGDLRTYLMRPPPRSHPWQKPLGTNQNLSLAQAANLSNDAKARREMLTRDHFTHGAVRCWIGADSSVADVRLYQFSSVSNAQAFFRQDVNATSHGYTSANTARISGVPGGWAYSDPKRDSQGFVHVITLAVKGDVVFVVSIAEHSETVDLTLPDSLVKQQYRKL